MTDDARTALNDHLLQGLEDELVTTRTELTRAASHNAEVEGELFAVAQRLAAKEAEHEAALNALKKSREELFDARSQLEAAQAEVAKLKSQAGFAERAARKVLRAVKK